MHTKKTIVNTVRVFIDEHPERGCPRPIEIAVLEVHSVIGVAIDSFRWRLRPLRHAAYKAIHGDTAHALPDGARDPVRHRAARAQYLHEWLCRRRGGGAEASTGRSLWLHRLQNVPQGQRFQ